MQIGMIESDSTEIVSLVASNISELWNAVLRVTGGEQEHRGLSSTDDAKNGRLHTCLISVLIHLINKMGRVQTSSTEIF